MAMRVVFGGGFLVARSSSADREREIEVVICADEIRRKTVAVLRPVRSSTNPISTSASVPSVTVCDRPTDRSHR